MARQDWLTWVAVALYFVTLLAVLGAVIFVTRVHRAMQRWTSRWLGVGLQHAERIVNIALDASRADTDRLIAALDALAASSPWRRLPPPPVTMAHTSRVERPPETWPELPAPPRLPRPDLAFSDVGAGNATTNHRTLASERDR